MGASDDHWPSTSGTMNRRLSFLYYYIVDRILTIFIGAMLPPVVHKQGGTGQEGTTGVAGEDDGRVA